MEITINEMREYAPVHGADDQEKLEELIASMEANGYEGVPLVAYQQQFLTGAHRYEAVNLLDSRYHAHAAERTVDSILVIDIADVFEEAGLDFYETLETEGTPDVDDYGFVYVLDALPDDIKDKYGIDIH